MRKLDIDQFLTLAGVGRRSFRVMANRNEVALAFGVSDRLAGGNFLDLDVISMICTDELAPAFGRVLAASLVRGFSDVWCMAVSEADASPQPIFLVVIEQGKKFTGGQRATREGVNMGYGTMADLADKMASVASLPPRMTLVNLTSLLADVRAKASAIGLDFSQPFIDLADLAFIQARDEAKAHREKNVGRLKAARP